jgi:predicted enzyme related to lactoylglutathione lyase
MNRVVHFEIPATDPEKALGFYQKVFGWKFEQWGNEPYWMTQGGEAEQPGIGGAIMKRQNDTQPIVNTIDVANLEATVEQIEACGGQIAMPKMTIPGVGWMVYFKDTEGNIFGAMQADSQAGRQEA